MGRIRFTLFTGQGHDHEPADQVPAEEVMDFTSFRQFLVACYGITNPELEFHIHDKNETCNGSGDVAPHIWKGIAGRRQSSDSDSPIYYVCFVKKEREASVTICYDSIDEGESFQTAQPEAGSDPSWLDLLPAGSTFMPRHRSVSTGTIMADPRSSSPAVVLNKKRAGEYDILERPAKNLRRATTPLLQVFDEDEITAYPEPSGGRNRITGQMMRPAVVKINALNSRHDREVSEDEAILALKLPDGKFLVGTYRGTQNAVLLRLDNMHRLKHFVQNYTLRGGQLPTTYSNKQARDPDVEYQGVFRKYQNRRSLLKKRLVRLLHDESEEEDVFEDEEDVSEDDEDGENAFSGPTIHEGDPYEIPCERCADKGITCCRPDPPVGKTCLECYVTGFKCSHVPERTSTHLRDSKFEPAESHAGVRRRNHPQDASSSPAERRRMHQEKVNQRINQGQGGASHAMSPPGSMHYTNVRRRRRFVQDYDDDNDNEEEEPEIVPRVQVQFTFVQNPWLLTLIKSQTREFPATTRIESVLKKAERIMGKQPFPTLIFDTARIVDGSQSILIDDEQRERPLDYYLSNDSQGKDRRILHFETRWTERVHVRGGSV